MNPDSETSSPPEPAGATPADGAPAAGRGGIWTILIWVGAFAVAAMAFVGAGVYAKSYDMAAVESVCRDDGFNDNVCACVRRQAERDNDLAHYLPMADRFFRTDEAEATRQSARALQLCIGDRRQATPWLDRAMMAGGAG